MNPITDILHAEAQPTPMPIVLQLKKQKLHNLPAIAKKLAKEKNAENISYILQAIVHQAYSLGLKHMDQMHAKLEAL